PVDGIISVDAIARQVEAEGASKVVVLSDDIGKYDAIHAKFPAGTEFHDRAELDAVQRRLREMKGVTILIYEQTCAAEKRRRRKKGELVDPARRLYINERVCEGCGDCSVQSNCVAVVPLETDLGRKRAIDQSSCNKDYSCAKGFCPSFVGVVGGRLKKRPGALAGPGAARFQALVDALPARAAHHWTGPYDLLVTGVGGTGVVTVGALIAMAAHLEGHAASVLDFMGFAQKGGSVLSFVRLAKDKAALNQVRIDAQQADAVLACDVVVAASADALQTVRHGRTRVLANRHEIPVAESLSNPDADLRIADLLAKLAFAAGADRVETMDAQQLAQDFIGDTIVANIVAMGYAWQRGLVPVGLAAMRRAIELNGVAVEANKAAFSLGRLAAADPAAARVLLHEPDPANAEAETLDALIDRSARFLAAYQNQAYAERYRRVLRTVRLKEEGVAGVGGELRFTRAVAAQLRKLMAYKDEYEVARLYTDGEFAARLAEQFEGDFSLEFYMAPPALVKPKGKSAAPKKVRFGPWLLPALRVLARGKGLRGTAFDPFGRTEERKLERRLIADYEARIAELVGGLTAEKITVASAIANVPGSIRGYGHVKLASLAIARARESELLNRFDPDRYPRPAGAAVAGQFRGIPVTSA
ncbi:MAG: indolepyruvate ferredoxin oxidoreductase family protein, partial [Caldimonas sp.]